MKLRQSQSLIFDLRCRWSNSNTAALNQRFVAFGTLPPLPHLTWKLTWHVPETVFVNRDQHTRDPAFTCCMIDRVSDLYTQLYGRWAYIVHLQCNLSVYGPAKVGTRFNFFLQGNPVFSLPEPVWTWIYGIKPYSDSEYTQMVVRWLNSFGNPPPTTPFQCWNGELCRTIFVLFRNCQFMTKTLHGMIGQLCGG